MNISNPSTAPSSPSKKSTPVLPRSTAARSAPDAELEEQLRQVEKYAAEGHTITINFLITKLKLSGPQQAGRLLEEFERRSEAGFQTPATKSTVTESLNEEGGTGVSTHPLLSSTGNEPPLRPRLETATDQIAEAGPTEDTPAAREAIVPQLIPIADLVQRTPFSNLLPIDRSTKDSISADMAANGCDRSHPIHVWSSGEELVLVDGFTRVAAAQENGITAIAAFFHEFADEDAALEFAVKVQINRRNIKDGELLALVEVFDRKLEPGAGQSRQNGQFQPRASDDATGKTATRTAERLGTSTTQIERVRRVLRYPNQQIRDLIIAGVLSLNAAVERIREEEATTNNAASGDVAELNSDTQVSGEELERGDENETTESPSTKPTGRAAKRPKNNAQTAAPDYSPFEQDNRPSFVGACWNPLLLTKPAVPKIGEVPKPGYVLDESRLEIDPKAKVFKKPSKHFANRRILVSASIDLFNANLAPDKIRDIIKACQNVLPLDFLFWSAHPEALAEFVWPENTLVGATIRDQGDVESAEEAFAKITARKWLSVEQLTMQLTFSNLKKIDWLVVRTPTRIGNAEHQHDPLKTLLQQAWAANCPVYFDQGVFFSPEEPPRAKTTEAKARATSDASVQQADVDSREEGQDE